jgi:hypothetical protein
VFRAHPAQPPKRAKLRRKTAVKNEVCAPVVRGAPVGLDYVRGCCPWIGAALHLAHGAVCASGSNELLVQAVNLESDYNVTFFECRKKV